ncbi:hypothetical protein ACFVSW_17735 [Neobacillus sp. NPDC058068]|uniref:hypothetical protein n=1 Tax=Neobacillus sp. NPDC058068 TaxID=3346325 RepID=UPI0036DB502A
MDLEEVYNFLVDQIEIIAGRPLFDEEKDAILEGLQSDQHFFDKVELRLSKRG